MPPVVSGSIDLSSTTSTWVDVGGVAYLVTEQRRRIVNDVVEHAFLQDIAAPGPNAIVGGIIIAMYLPMFQIFELIE